MGSPLPRKGRRRRWALGLVVVAGVATWLGFRVQSYLHVEPDLSVPPRPQVEAGGGVTHPDFRGEWKLDLAASESIVPLLRAKGKSAFESAVAARVPSTQVIRGDHRRMTVVVKTPLFERTHELPTDGTPMHTVDPEGNEAEAATRWSEDGQSLVTTSTNNLNGQAVQVTLTRSLDPDRRTMYMDLEYRLPEGEPIKVRRVFRLVGLPEGEAGR